MSETPEDRPLDPEQEAMVAAFSEKLEGFAGSQLETDDDGRFWLTFGEETVPITDEQAATYSTAVYEAALAKVKRAAASRQPGRFARAVGIFLAFASLAIIGAVAARLVQSILGL